MDRAIRHPLPIGPLVLDTEKIVWIDTDASRSHGRHGVAVYLVDVDGPIEGFLLDGELARRVEAWAEAHPWALRGEA